MYSIDSNNRITLVRGDSFAMPIALTVTFPPGTEKTQIILQPGDRVIHTIKETAYHSEIIIQHIYTAEDCTKDGYIPIELVPEETSELPFGTYRYDLELIFANNMTTTFAIGDFVISEEITDRISAERLAPTAGTKITAEIIPTKVYEFQIMPSDIKGDPGKDGHSPYIGENGNWYQWDDEAQEYVDTEIKAEGTPGKDGAVPTVSPALTLTAGGWADNVQTVSFTHDINKRNVIDVTPESLPEWAKCGVYAVSETPASIVFKCSEVPTADLEFQVTSTEVVYSAG